MSKKIISSYVQCTRHKQYFTFRQNFERVEGGKIYPQVMSKFSIPLIGGNSHGRNGATSHRIYMILSPLSQWSRSRSLTCSNYPDFAAPSGREGGVSTLWICRSRADLRSRDQSNKSKGYKCFGDIETGGKRKWERYLVQYFPYSRSSHRNIGAGRSSTFTNRNGGGGWDSYDILFPWWLLPARCF